MLTRIKEDNGEICVAVKLSGIWSKSDADKFRKALVDVFEACITHEETKEQVPAESFYWLNCLIKDFSM